MRTLVAVALACLSVAVSAADRVRVAVRTEADASGLVDKPTQERLKAVADIKRRLAKNAKIEVVETAEQAQAVIDVVSAGAEDGGKKGVSAVIPTGQGGALITQPSTVYEFVGRATVKSGTFATTLESGIGPFNRTYGENLARKFEDWLKDNFAALLTVPVGAAAK